jgi:hypothetical protein
MMDNKPSPMTQVRVDLLNNLGFVWNVYEETWERQLNNFKRFREEYGHSNVPPNHPTYPNLYPWISVQRRYYVLMKQGKNCQITRARVETLDRIGFSWDLNKDKWWANLRDLTDFQDKHGHFTIPKNYSINPKLRRWNLNQRMAYKAGSMPEDRIHALDGIGFNGSPHNTK